MATQLPILPVWLAQTRIHAPLPRADVMARPTLLARLRAFSIAHPFTLISAPAGYGKTTLLAEFCRDAVAARPHPDRPAAILPAAWLSLEEEDNDPARFLQAIVASLRCLNPACGATALALLRDLPHPAAQVRQISAALINDILETMPAAFVLALDDLHLIKEPAIFLALDHLIAHSPASLHLLIGARQDPPLALARLRARGQLAELRQVDLRFAADEIACFLNEMQGLALSREALARLEGLSEGWPAGLRLLASSLGRIAAAERSAFIANLRRGDRDIFEFLAREVLDRQEADLRCFLLQTSILAELTPDLCAAVSGRADAGARLEELYRRNLFIVDLRTGGSYRYHALFREFLRRRLALELPEQMQELHRRAAAVGAPDHAIRHWLAAEGWDEAANAIERVGEAWLRQGLLETLAGWLHEVPSAVVEGRPQLLYLLASCAWERGDLDGASAYLRRALAGFEAAGDGEGQGRVLVELANCLVLQAEAESGAALFERALALPLSPLHRMQALMGRAGLEFFRNNLLAAAADFAAASAVMEKSADADVLRRLLSHLSAGYAALPGGKTIMEQILQAARRHFGDQISPARVIIEELTAVLHVWRGELRQAIAAGEMTLAVKERLGGSYPFVGVDAGTIVVDCYAALGQFEQAERYVPRLFEGVRDRGLVEQMRGASLFVVARHYWYQGRMEEVRGMYDRLAARQSPQELAMDGGFRARLRGLLALSEGRFEAAERALAEAVQIEDGERFGALFGSARVLLAYFYTLRDDAEEALAALAPILAEAEQRGMPGLIILYGPAAVPPLRLAVQRGLQADFAARLLRLLAADADPRPLFVPETGETLTAREAEVLALLAGGASNRAIAGQLVIGEGTVKSHVHHILGKLGASSRTEAAARGRRLGR